MPSKAADFLRRIERTYLVLGAALFVTIMAIGPLDAPLDAILVALETGLLGFVLGYEYGSRRRQLLNVRGRGPRVSESIGRTRGISTYRSYDVLERPFELEPVVVSGIVYRALRTAPFLSPPDFELPPDAKEGRWLFQTEDSYRRATFLDEQGILAMARFCEGSFKEEPLRAALEKTEEIRSLGLIG